MKLCWETTGFRVMCEGSPYILLSSRHNAVMMVIDSVSKQVHFIPTHMIVTVKGAARLFLYQVWKLHGLPKCVVSDHGP